MKFSNVKNAKSIALAVVSILVAVSPGDCGNSTPSAPIKWTEGQTFSIKHWKTFAPPGSEQIVQSLTLHGTYYHTPTLPFSPAGIPVKDPEGNLLGPRLAQNEFCSAGVAGAFRSAPSANGPPQTYNIASAPSDAPSETDCTGVFANVLEEYRQGKRIENWPVIVAAIERSRYRPTDAPYGNGGGNRWLIPWRSIATYNPQIQPGSIIYVPQVDGLEVNLPSGETVRHDGYFFAADSGNGIKENHVDFFSGLLSSNNRPPLLTGIDGAKSPFVAQVVNRDDATAYFKELHRMQ